MNKAIEYIGINPSTKVYGKKNLLYCEMELLNSIKHYKNYKKLRKQEIVIKKIVKKAASEIADELRNLNTFLPEIKNHKYKTFEISETQKKRKELDEEINEIKKRIAELG